MTTMSETRELTCLTSREHLEIAAEHFGLDVTIYDGMMTCRRELPGIGMLTYRAPVSPALAGEWIAPRGGWSA